MSVKLMSAIFETEFRDLSDMDGNTTKASTAKFIVLALADHANDEGEGAYPSLETIAKKTSLSRTCVINAMDALKHNGIILSVGESKWHTKNYTVNPDAFVRVEGSKARLLVNPVDPPSQPSLPQLVNPVDPNHPLTIQESSLRTDEKKPVYQVQGIANKIFAGLPIEQSDLDGDNRERVAINAFESAFGIERPWNWYPAKTSEEKTWRDFRAYIVEKYEADHECFRKYVTWRNEKYSKGTMSNLAIKRSPQDFPDSWVMFLASDSVYGQKEADQPKAFPTLVNGRLVQ